MTICLHSKEIHNLFHFDFCQQSIRHDALSPLLLPNVPAAQSAVSGTAVTIDNVQLGQLVQRGKDWSDGDEDGGAGSIGVVVKLDGDGTYVWAAFPSRNGQPIEPICCRMGANCRWELQVGPGPLHDYVSGSADFGSQRNNGIVHVGEKAASISAGHMINQHCMVVGVDVQYGIVFAAPMEQITTPSFPKQHIWKMDRSSFVHPGESKVDPPDTWQTNTGQFVEVCNSEERDDVLNLFYNKSGGLKRQRCRLHSIQRVEDKWLWDSYNRAKEKARHENWGIENEVSAFAVNTEALTKVNLHNFQVKQYSPRASVVHKKFNKRQGKARVQMILCRVVMGRDINNIGKVGTQSPLTSHSEVLGNDLFACRGVCMAYPEYIITYTDNSASPPSPSNSDSGQESSGRSESKQCIICMERPVRYVTVPCGHPCLCEQCNTPQNKRKLKGHCPECRAYFHSTCIIYGRVVNDE